MKTLLICVSETPVVRNLLRGDFLKVILADTELKTVILTTPDKKERLQKEFEPKGIKVVAIATPRAGFIEKALTFISRNTLKTGTVTFNQNREPGRNSLVGKIKFITKRLLWGLVGRSHLFQKMFRFFELKRKPSRDIARLFDDIQPDLVFSTILINPNIDLPVIVEAKRRGIKTVAMVRGWDNFTSHGFMRVLPDLFLLQNEYLKEMGLKYQFMKPESLKVVGFPQYDYYFDQSLRESRETFLQKLNISPTKRVVLFGAMGDFLFPKEGEIAEIFEELIEEKKIPDDLVLVFRAHPAFESPLEQMKNLKHVIPDRVANYPSGQLNDWDMGRREVAHLINSIIHSEMTINAGSTIALDALALEKPAISIAFEKTKVPYWLSAARFRDAYTHYEYLMPLGGIGKADSKEELASVINRYLKNPEADREGRERVKKDFFSPFTGHVSETIGQIILEEINR